VGGIVLTGLILLLLYRCINNAKVGVRLWLIAISGCDFCCGTVTVLITSAPVCVDRGASGQIDIHRRDLDAAAEVHCTMTVLVLQCTQTTDG